MIVRLAELDPAADLASWRRRRLQDRPTAGKPGVKSDRFAVELVRGGGELTAA
jgi:hypothetical protein